MRTRPLGRRMFLLGSGAGLLVPFLPSLQPRAARAQTVGPAIRYVQIANTYGPATRHFYGSLTPGEEVQPFVRVRKLSEVTGNISPMIGSVLSSHRDKLTLIHGLDVPCVNANHNRTFPTCASGYAAGLDGDHHPPTSGQPSVDVVIAGSSKVYGASTPPSRRLLVLNPVPSDSYSKDESFSFQRNVSGNLEMIRPTKTTLGVSDLLESGLGEAATVQRDPEALLNAVHGDYARVRDSARLGAADKERLEAYMALLNDAIGPRRGAPECRAPTLDAEPDTNAIVANQIKLLAAAMMCDATRVASVLLGFSEGYDVRHTQHHDEICCHDDNGLFDDFSRIGRWVGQLVDTFVNVPDGEGTSLLDNSLVYWSSQYGNAVTGDAHRSTNMPVLVAGSARGALTTGYYIDYRKDGQLSDDKGRGITLNNLLVTIMNCMGLTSADYELAGRAGYGEYHEPFFQSSLRPKPEQWWSTGGRRAALPFFYKGSVSG
jgi:hypothetical protein